MTTTPRRAWTVAAVAVAAVLAMSWSLTATSAATTTDPVQRLRDALTTCQDQQAQAHTAAETAWAANCVALAQRALDAATAPSPTATATATATPTATATTAPPTTPPATTAPPTASPSPTVTQTPPPAFVWPSAATTGPRNAAGAFVSCDSLPRVGGMTVSSGVVQNVDVHGPITVTGPNVVIRNVCVRPDSAVNGAAITVSWVDGTTIDHVRIVGAGIVHQGVQSFDDSQTAVVDSDISGTDDGISAGVGDYERNYIHGLRAGGHADGQEGTGWRPLCSTKVSPCWRDGSTLVVRGNRIDNPLTQTSAVFLGQDNHVQYRNATIEHNWLSGGSYTMYAGAGQYGAGVNLVIINNVFGPCGTSGCVTALDRSGPGNVWSGNVMTNGSPVAT